MLRKALHLHQAGDTDRAKSLYNKVLTIVPDDADALHLLGLIEHQDGNLLAARQLIDRAILHEPAHPFFYNNLGNVLKDLGLLEDALRSYRQAIVLKADYREAYHNQALIYCNRNDLPNAVDCYEKMLLHFPNDVEIEKKIADLCFEMMDFDKSASYYHRILPKKVMDHSSFFKLAVIATHGDDIDQAIEYYGNALRLNPSMAEAWNNLGLLFKQRDTFKEAARCFKRAIEISPAFHEALHNLGNVYVATDQLNRAEACFKRVIEIRPDYTNSLIQLGVLYKKKQDYQNALKYYHSALTLKPGDAELNASVGDILIAQKRYDAAKPFISKALEIEPEYPIALFSLAVIEGEIGSTERAIELYHRVLELEPESKESLYNLACRLADQDLMSEAIRAALQALQIDPDYAEMHNNLGSYYRATGDYDSAMVHFKRAIEIDNSLAHPHFNLGLTYLVRGDFHNGWKEYDWRSRVEMYKQEYRYNDAPIWDGTPFCGKTLLVYDEQGFGDTFQFIRYLPLVKMLGGRVVFETRAPIIPLIQHFPGIDELCERDDSLTAKTGFDLCIPLMSIPGRIGTTLSSIPDQVPYISSPADRRIKWQRFFKENRINVGIAWSGNKKHINDAKRSCDIEYFERIMQVPNLSVFSLQKDVSSEEKKILNRLYIEDLGSTFVDFADTATVMDFLDLVVSVDTSVVHLAGAMKKRVWALLAFEPDWRWLLHTDKSPWYPTISLLRQTVPGNWSIVFDDVQRRLFEFAKNYITPKER